LWALRGTRIGRDPMLFRLAFSAVTEIELSYASRLALDKTGYKAPMWSAHEVFEVFATKLNHSKALF
jgi:hypothetical protein